MKLSISLDSRLLDLLGLTEKDRDVYLALLQLGAAPLRRIAESSSLNRATAYDALQRLIAAGLVHYLDAKRHRYFVAEDPERLRTLMNRRELALEEAREDLNAIIPEIRAIIGRDAHRPPVRYLEGNQGVRELLEDVLAVSAKSKGKMYRIYSSSDLREQILASWTRFTAERKAQGISVRAISMGEGGQTAGLDERRWLSHEDSAPTYVFLYGSKTAYVGLDRRKQLFAVVIEDAAMAQTQKLIFDSLWKTLG
jgi:HTH-type transcriptional regulator, sugar sensing transcriptional regulator